MIGDIAKKFEILTMMKLSEIGKFIETHDERIYKIVEVSSTPIEISEDRLEVEYSVEFKNKLKGSLSTKELRELLTKYPDIRVTNYSPKLPPVVPAN